METNGMVGTLHCDVPARRAGGIRGAAVSAASSGGVSPPVPETETRTEPVLALAGGTPALPTEGVSANYANPECFRGSLARKIIVRSSPESFRGSNFPDWTVERGRI